MELTIILAIPVAAALVALASERAAKYSTLVALASVLVLSTEAAVRVSRDGIIVGLGGALTLDPLAALYLWLVSFVGFTASLYSIGYLHAREQSHAATPPRYRQYYPLFNTFIASMLAVALIADLAVIWIAIELTTLFSAFLVAYEDRTEALEAAWKYVMLTTMGALIALLGVLIVYYGVNRAGQPVTWTGLVAAAPVLPPALLKTAFVLWLIGFGTKAGLVPLHTWLPDAHSQAPASICALLSGVETSAALYMILRLYPALIRNPGIEHAGTWLLVAGLITTGTAAFLLLQVRDFKRLFAFSTVEHMGIILTASALKTSAAGMGAIYQLFGHALVKPVCFYAAGLAMLVLGTQNIDEARGLLSRSPAVGWAFMLAALAIAGTPPFVLFISEFAILRAGFTTGQFAATGLLAAFIVLAFVAILYNAGRIVFGKPGAGIPDVRLPASSLAAVGLALVPIVVFGFYLPPPFLVLMRQASMVLRGIS